MFDIVERGSKRLEINPLGLLAACSHHWLEDCVDKLGDARRRAEVLRESDQTILSLILDRIELSNIGAAKAIDRLLGIADEEEPTLLAAGDGVGDLRLQRVVVLELVDQQALEPVPHGRGDRTVAVQQSARADQQVLKLQLAALTSFVRVVEHERAKPVVDRNQEAHGKRVPQFLALLFELGHPFTNIVKETGRPVGGSAGSLDPERRFRVRQQSDQPSRLVRAFPKLLQERTQVSEPLI